jgi:CRP-like cAMP-binding protein
MTAMRATSPAAAGNRILDGLSNGDRTALLAHASRVALLPGDRLGEAGQTARAVYFPLSGFAALLLPANGRPALGLGLVGKEGMIGAVFARGDSAGPVATVVHGEGFAWRVPAVDFAQVLARSARLRRGVGQSLNATIAQLASTMGCMHFHAVEARLACWLALAGAHAPGEALHFTHQQLADLLGVQRGAVTLAAGALQRRKLIHYVRGTITILASQPLEDAACECCRPPPAVAARAAAAGLSSAPKSAPTSR